MITDYTLDLTLVELTRTMKALQALRAARKSGETPINFSTCDDCFAANAPKIKSCAYCSSLKLSPVVYPSKEHAAAKRASMDLTRKLADLRQGR